ncbi:hypothetical protein HUN59_05345 [Curtobacterium sp. Csp2]|uniref:hypothetical protein n=1 Tax=Curtobacterium sp. Csp2 TaxID=2495430 RepID=UPI001580EA43|nr:hypothetical protein [Curtobacterium sp. Csp2]QKS15722.1 hypothetical protein HUN59_05345 [Curtobacterium sp. Csp2]
MNSQSADDMYGRVFPGEKWTIAFEATDEQADAMTAHVDAHTADPDERVMFLQMLGLAPSVSAFNPTAREAWTKKPPKHDPNVECKHGHQRSEHGYRNSAGRLRCRVCKRDTDLRSARKQASGRAA